MKQSNDNKKQTNYLALHNIVPLELIVIIILLFLVSMFSINTDASIEIGNLQARSKVGTWYINNHKVHNSQIQVVQKNNQNHIYYGNKEYQLIPHISHKKLRDSHLKKLYKQDRVFEIHKKHNDKILEQTKAPKSLNHMPIYENTKR